MNSAKTSLLLDHEAHLRRSTGGTPQTEVTRQLIYAILQALVGIFVFGYNTSLFNIPADVIRENASEYDVIEDFNWEIVNAMFPLGGMYQFCKTHINVPKLQISLHQLFFFFFFPSKLKLSSQRTATCFFFVFFVCACGGFCYVSWNWCAIHWQSSRSLWST